MEIENLKARLIELIQNDLPGESAHVPMAPLNRPLSSFALKSASNPKPSSVAIVLCFQSGNVELILIQRPDYEGAHSGQISFPGGKRDPEDIDTEFTARRECMEEIGLILEKESLLGKLTDVYIPVSNFLVHPYLYLFSGSPMFRPDEREVSEILTFPIGHLLSSENLGTMDIHLPDGMIMRKVPCFLFEEKKVWGATALILNELRELFLKMD